MARMFPSTGPVAKQLSDEFVVIHSLPWIAQVAKSVDGRSVPTGELDFLILHPSLGIVAIEVKRLFYLRECREKCEKLARQYIPFTSSPGGIAGAFNY